MAVTTTPLGFQKPDGNESVRNGDNVISANAQTAETTISAVRGRLDYVEAAVASGGGGGGTGGSTLSPDPSNPGLYFIV